MNKIIYIFLLLFISFNTLIAEEKSKTKNSVDCVIIEDENLIVCKYIQQWSGVENEIRFNWIEPNGKLSRSKNLIIPVGHLSIYDFRFLKGRTKGVWTFIAKDKNKEYKTNFTIEK
jgi:hypothetical protein